jgi:uncharacterized alkaline shock family protein YloU
VIAGKLRWIGANMSTKPIIAQEPEVEAPLTEETVEETAETPAEEASATSLAASEEGDLTFSDADEDLDSEDSLTFSNGVIEKIVAIAVRDVPGVLGMKGGFINRVQETFGAADPTKGVSVEVMPDSSVRVNISVLIEYGAFAPQVFEDVKKVVVKQVVGMTGLEVGGVNLRIEDVLTPEEYENMQGGSHDEEEAE